MMFNERRYRDALAVMNNYLHAYFVDLDEFNEMQDCLTLFEELLEQHLITRARLRSAVNTAHSLNEILEKKLPIIEKELENPPLKFYEIYEGMWVWDNIRKKYRQVYTVEKRHYTRFINFDGWEIIFRDGRFFRREVNEKC